MEMKPWRRGHGDEDTEKKTRVGASGEDDPCPGKPANHIRWLGLPSWSYLIGLGARTGVAAVAAEASGVADGSTRTAIAAVTGVTTFGLRTLRLYPC